MKKVSIGMLAYNSGKFIRESIESALAQITDFDYEIVIAEDCSTDNTLDIAREYALRYPGKIKLIINPVNLGMSGNFHLVLNNCSGEYIAFLDSDDYWIDPQKLQKQVNFLDKNKDYGLVYTDCRTIDENSDEIEWNEMEYLRKQFSSGNLFFKLLKETAFIPNLTTCFRKELIIADLQIEDVWFFEDWWLWMRIAMKTKFYFINEQTGAYRLHSNNITKIRVQNKENKKVYQKKAYSILYSNIIYFNNYNKTKLNKPERELLFKRVIMLLYRSQVTIKMKFKLLSLFFKYFPGVYLMISLLIEKMKKNKKLTLYSSNLFFLNFLLAITGFL